MLVSGNSIERDDAGLKRRRAWVIDRVAVALPHGINPRIPV